MRPQRLLLPVSSAATLVILLGCEPLAPDVGPPQNERCANVDSDPEVDVSFADDIVPGIWVPHCAKCHDPEQPNPIGVEISGLDLTSHASVLAGGVNSGTDGVVPGKPCDSLLVTKLSAGPPFGSRMPFNGPPFLTAEQVRLVADWIAEGAKDN